MHHPFGKEETASQKQLFGFFCECLRRGEWELAQACVPQLHEAQGDIPKKVEEILQALVVCPDQLRCGLDINPQRLAWVWFLVLEKWFSQEKKLLPSVFRRKLEFLLLSEDLQSDIPEDILKELYEALAQDSRGPVLDGNQRQDGWTLRLSSEAVSVLWDLLRQAPQPAQALLQLLLREDDGLGPCGWPLQKALVDFIRRALQVVQGLATGPPGEVDAIYGALRTLRCPAEPLGVELRLLCEELLEACRAEGSPLQEERVLGCLLHKAGRGLLSLYGHTYAVKAAEKPAKAIPSGKVSSDHLDPEQAMLALFSNPDPAQAWKSAYFYCLSNSKHFLEQILVTALTLLKEEDFPSLGCLLDREFRPLSRLLVLLGWTHCQSLASAKSLLQTLHGTQDQGCDQLLREACDGLGAHLEVLEWCVQQSSNPIPKRDLLCHLHGGDSHSVLYSLHHLTNLPALREEDVLKLLQKVPAKDPQQEHDEQPSRRYRPIATRHPSLRRGRRTRRSQPDGRDRGSNPSLEGTSGELSTSTSEGSLNTVSGRNELDGRLPPLSQNSLIPMMFSPPESLLASCILRGNFAEAHQVVFMFNLKSSPSSGELMFVERYQEVIQELARVEHKIENQNTDGGSSTIRRTGSGRSTLQAIGSAAAAGMVFYSISDVTDKLLSTSGEPIPTLQEDFWMSNTLVEPTAPLREVLEDLSPPAMAAFDLACSQCQLWKTCKQLLETAERRLKVSLESRGRRLDHVLLNVDGIRGFPVVLQQISKILNYPLMSAGQTKSESVEEKGGSAPRYNIAELLQKCWPSLTEDCVAGHATLSQQLEQVLQALREALQLPEPKGSPLSSLVEQAAQKAPEAEAHPVHIQTQLLQKNLGRQTPAGSRQTDYLGAFFSYCSTMAAVLLRSLSSEPDHVEVKVGNPFVLLQQSSSQLVSHLLLERQVPPDRLAALLAREGLSLSVPKVIVNCCCEHLALCSSQQSQQTSSLLTHLSVVVQLHTSHCLEDLPLSTPSSPKPTGNPTLERKPRSSPRDSSLPALTSSALTFLKSRSKLLATVACLGASQGSKLTRPSLSWKELRGRREVPLSAEQVAQECERLLEQFPMLKASLMASWGPLRRSTEQGQSLAVSLCGRASLSTVLLSLHSPSAVDVLTEAFEEALVARDWPRALQLIEVYGRDMDDLSDIKDAVLSCAAACDKEGWQFLFPVKDASLRSRLTLQFVDRWPLEWCLEILAYCISDTTVQDGLKCELQRKLAELRVYQKILGLQATMVWCDWQALRNCCIEDPSTVMNMILEAKEYGLCEEWGCLYPIPREHLISLHQKHLLHLLERGDHEKALQLLRRIPDPTMCLEVTEQSLDQHPSLATSHFLANYLTTHFYGELTTVRHREIQALYIGSKVLLTLPEPHRASYSHLSSNPLLMLEQLLMNMKVDWATVAVQTLQQLLTGQEIGFTMDEVDSLLSRYARKALDFPYSLREKRSDSVIHLQEVGQASDLETLSRSPSAEFSSAAPGVSTVHSPSPRERSFPESQPPPEFVPPATPPGRHQWVPDESTSICMVCCRERFTMFNRRHHCRRCGRLVCSACSTKKMVVEGCRESPTRVCNQCYSYYNKDVPEENPEQPEAPDSSKSESPPYSAVVRVSKAAEVEWILDLNEEENELVRSEFYYEQSPSASLCIAILNLHRDSTVCGHQLIEHCCRLSQGLTNPEVDAGLLTDIMKQLLFSAKMMFVKAGRSQDLALCDSYISKVDVLNILVAASYRHVPSLDQILQPAAVTRLRNQLLEAEYYQLGVEVSTKTGLDPTGAWHAWGMACLKAGNLPSAREKFSRCLKPPFDLNQLSHGSRLVQDVIEYLESTVRPVLSLHDDDYFATLKELEATLRTQSLSLEVIPEGKIMNNTYYQECLFYLHNYSTNLAIISFYMRHSCLREALLHLLNKESPPEVFIEGIFQPSYKSGKLHTLENLLESIDPTLESWGKYLIAACQHLQKKNYYHILYELQQFMKDQVRAAMTCIRFFSHKAKTYTELGEKLSWLLKAKDHLKIYLQDTSRSTRRKKTTFFQKKMTAADVSRHMNTLQLQMEVTRFLHRCESAGTSQITTLPLPTLFGNNHMKMDVACKVMLGGKNVEDGFGIAFRVLQDFQLDAAATYCRAARQLVEREKYSEIQQLLKCVSESGMAAKSDGDTILLNCLEAFKRIPPQELEGLIQAIHSDDNKVQAYLTCCKLRSAYLVAVKQEHSRAAALVQQVQQAAKSSGDAVVQDICTQWLLTSHTRSAHGSGSRK
ncbi:zinc finger FYVE domain-containing protein 26 isoform X4 [Suricata suricatta]|uniref:zinc finger FYVE domain-containing protein 26 isoform X4 n=1 Tax=Suricata suricatta TaxID=37032 RepID=UPI00115581DC|nr:zinc finger FYVE domain-containing protein 26 isoform X4 [Suricata suricatta]